MPWTVMIPLAGVSVLGVFYLAWAGLIVRFAGPSLTGREDPGLPMAI